MTATTTHDDLVEIAMGAVRGVAVAGALYRRHVIDKDMIEAALAAVTPEIERRAKVAVLEKLRTDAHAVSGWLPLGPTPLRWIERWIDVTLTTPPAPTEDANTAKDAMR